MKQRTLAILLGASLSFGSALTSAETEHNIHVYKSPTCGCCTDWVKHLEDNGFEVDVSEVDNVTPVKNQSRPDAGPVQLPHRVYQRLRD